MWIFGNADDEQDSIIIVFYILKKNTGEKKLTLRVREYVRSLDGDIALP